MFFKVSVLIFAVFVQTMAVVSQQYHPKDQRMTQAEMWNPYTWIIPYQAAASKAWTEYLQKAQEASNQLYQQWEKTGAGNLIAAGMNYAQLAAMEAQKSAEAAMSQTKEAIMQRALLQS